MLEIKKQFCLYNFSYDRPTINIGMVERGKYKITKQNKKTKLSSRIQHYGKK